MQDWDAVVFMAKDTLSEGKTNGLHAHHTNNSMKMLHGCFISIMNNNFEPAVVQINYIVHLPYLYSVKVIGEHLRNTEGNNELILHT